MDSPIRILIAEDSAADAELIARELCKAGLVHTSKAVKSKEEFLKALQEFTPDIVLCDYNMPGFGAPEAMEILKKQRLLIPLIVISGTIGEVLAVETLKAGATDYVMKDLLIKLGPAIKRAMEEERERVERKKAEEALKESEERYRFFVDNAVDVIWTSDLHLNYTYISPSALQMFGFVSDEMIGQSATKLLMPESAQVAIKELADELTMDASRPKDRTHTVQLQHMRRDGSTAWVEVKTAFMRGPDGLPTAILGSSRDITERRRADEAIRQAQEEELRLRDRFLSHASHELRTPLAAIYQFVTILLDGLAGELSPEQKEYLQIVFRNLQEYRCMIDDLMDVARGEAQGWDVRAEPVDIVPAIRRAQKLIEGFANARGIEIAMMGPDRLPDAVVDTEGVSRIVRHVIRHAVQNTPEGGTVRLWWNVDPDAPACVRVCVTDGAETLSEYDRLHIFEKMHQAGDAIDDGRKGLGLELHIAKTLVLGQGGRIWAERAAPHGNSFNFTFPLTQSSDSPECVLKSKNERGNGYEENTHCG